MLYARRLLSNRVVMPGLCFPGHIPLILSCSGTLRELDTPPIERGREGASLNCSVRIIVGGLGRSGKRITIHGNGESDNQRADKRVSLSIGVDLLKFPIDNVALAMSIYLPWPHAGTITRVGIPCFGIVYQHRPIRVERGEVRLEWCAYRVNKPDTYHRIWVCRCPCCNLSRIVARKSNETHGDDEDESEKRHDTQYGSHFENSHALLFTLWVDTVLLSLSEHMVILPFYYIMYILGETTPGTGEGQG
jgi:hypothetical protein